MQAGPRALQITLVIRHELIASHALDGYEQPHPHLWKIEARVAGEPVKGRVIDLPVLSDALKADLEGLEQCYLNDSPIVDEETRAFPTCETLGSFLFRRWDESVFARFRTENPTLKLRSIQVTLCEMDGREFGSALIEPSGETR